MATPNRLLRVRVEQFGNQSKATAPKRRPDDLPLHAGIETGQADAAVYEEVRDLHLPDCLGRRGFRDFRNRGGMKATFIELDIPIFE